MGCLDDLLARKATHEPRWEQVGRKLRLGVSGWHVDDETLEGPIRDALKGIRHDLVVPASDEGWPHLIHERQKVQLSFFDVLALLEFFEVSEECLLLTEWELRDFRDDAVVLTHVASRWWAEPRRS